jgi:hypothetical protein
MKDNFEIPKFKDQKALYGFLVENEDLIITSRKSAMKEAGGFYNPASVLLDEVGFGLASKSEGGSGVSLLDKDTLEIKAAINTTNMFDSHKDLHLNKMWNKSLEENKNPMHLEEHGRSFKNIIASGEDVNVYVETVSWKSLGYNFAGKTEVLTHEIKLRKSRHPYMHEQYAKGYVNNHSVGMFYSKMLLAVNDKDDYPDQYKNWEKYIDKGINKEVAEEWGYFWAIPEAKYIEGSAVPMGSNHLTPTREVKNQQKEETDKELTEKLNAYKKFLCS